MSDTMKIIKLVVERKDREIHVDVFGLNNENTGYHNFGHLVMDQRRFEHFIASGTFDVVWKWQKEYEDSKKPKKATI